MLLFSTLALAAGFALDLLLGDPPRIPHIVRIMGHLIGALEGPFRRGAERIPEGAARDASLRRRGAAFALAVMLICAGVPGVVIVLCYRVAPALAFVVEAALCWQMIAVRDLRLESMAVCRRLKAGDLAGARRQVGRIVGRDTEVLDAAGVARAAVETVAESAGDGIASPLFWIMAGGPFLGLCYKACNTMDSMVGYKNARYLHFGRFAAKFDDVLNFVPSRLCALFMVAAACLLGFDGKGAFRVWRRDRRNHASPNSAQTESVVAGALGLRLAGPARYEGIMEEKPYIGDAEREIEAEDIVRANRLMIVTATLFFIFVMGVRICCMVAMFFATRE